MVPPGSTLRPDQAHSPELSLYARWNILYNRWKPTLISISTWVLAFSASMILGLLSFSGMFAIWPYLSLAFAAFIFAVIIEGEIYIRNVTSASEKLTDPKAYEHQLTDLYLQEKLVDYDKNRDLFLPREPSADDIRRVREYNQVLIFKQNEQFHIGFRTAEGSYATQQLTGEQCEFLKHYKQEQFMEIPGHHDLIQTILTGIDPEIKARPQENYPMFVRVYITQSLYLRKYNCYLHTQLPEDQSQARLTNMNQLLTQLEDEFNEALFHAPAMGETPDAADFPISITGKNYHLDFATMAMSVKESETATKLVSKSQPFYFVKPVVVPPKLDLEYLSDDAPALTNLTEQNYQYHRNKLIEWIRADSALWKNKLAKHTVHSRIAFALSAFAAAIMGIGTTYLIMEAVTVIPWLSILPLGLFPPIIGPLALLAGIAHGLLIYNSLTDMLLDNPAKKFMDRIRAISWQEMSLKRSLILALSVVLLIVTIFLTICTIGTWLTVFHKTKPLFTLIAAIPNVLLNTVIPTLIGISILPFSLQSLSNTLEGLESNPNLDGAIAGLNPWTWTGSTESLPRNVQDLSNWFSDRLWQHWIPGFLGVTAQEFAEETYWQKRNPYRIVYRLLFEPLRDFIFLGHLLSAGATADQMEGVPIIFSFWLNFFFEGAEDWDWIWGRAHVDNIDTLDLLKERAQKADDHNHDKNFPMRLLKACFEPVLRRAAKWDNDNRKPGTEDNVEKRYAKLQGLKPDATLPDMPKYRYDSNFKLFLFKSTMFDASASLPDTCCPTL